MDKLAAWGEGRAMREPGADQVRDQGLRPDVGCVPAGERGDGNQAQVVRAGKDKMTRLDKLRELSPEIAADAEGVISFTCPSDFGID